MQNAFVKSLLKKLPSLILVLTLLMIGSATPGHGQVAPDEASLREQIKNNFTEPPSILSLKIIENYAFGGLLSTYQGESLSGESQYFLASWDGSTWMVYYEGSQEFRQLLLLSPDGLVNPDLKEFLDYEIPNERDISSDDLTRATGYKLPWPGGTAYYITRAWASGPCPHGTTNAMDVRMPLNDIIVAARSGIVHDVKQSSDACGCNIDSNLGNWVIIRHDPDDGLYDWYVHIAKNGSLVSKGQSVSQGTPIAKSHQIGNTCSTSGLYSCAAGTCVTFEADCRPFPHLHFEVRNSAGNQLYVTFDDDGAVVGCQTYTSGNVPDSTPPVTTAALSGTPGENGYYVSNVTATLTATDDISGVKSTHYNLNSTGWLTYTPPLVITTNGRNVLQYYSIDNTNHTETTKSTSPFYIDTVAPANPTSITPGCSITSGVWQNSCNDLYFTWSGASDSTSGVTSYGYDWSGGGGGVTRNSYWDPSPVGDGSYTFKLQTTDVAGNWSNWKTMFTLKYDATSPTGSIQVKNGWEETNQALVTLNTPAADNASGVRLMRLRDSGGTWTEWLPYSSSIQWVLPPQTGQTHFVEVQYQDQAGNLSPTYSDAIFLDIYPDHPASQNFHLIKSTFGMSGTNAMSENFSLQGTLSQESASGYSGSENYQAISGYWGWMPKWIEFFLNFLPLMMN